VNDAGQGVGTVTQSPRALAVATRTVNVSTENVADDARICCADRNSASRTSSRIALNQLRGEYTIGVAMQNLFSTANVLSYFVGTVKP